jgi:GTP-binding protein Era
MMTRAGIVALAGKPNVGKSTLLNRMVGQKLSITSDKPQSTRERVVGIYTTPDFQMVLQDTPGLLEPQYRLQETMRAASLRALEDADVIVYLADARQGTPPPLTEAADLVVAPTAQLLTAINKIDALPSDRAQELRLALPDAHFISALTGEGVTELRDAIVERLPESPFLYPENDVSTQSLRFFTAELIRETALEQLGEEVPYSVACVVEEFREDRSPVYVRALVYVERESQKRIIIGAKGARIRSIGEAARGKIESLVGGQVYLDLWVKVAPNWRRDAGALERFGYRVGG